MHKIADEVISKHGNFFVHLQKTQIIYGNISIHVAYILSILVQMIPINCNKFYKPFLKKIEPRYHKIYCLRDIFLCGS
jgi:hypothetical protein